MEDLISRQALLNWVQKQREEVTKKQVAGTDGNIFTREVLVTMQRCLGTFETAINNTPTAYNLDAVVEQLREKEDIHNRKHQFLSAYIVEKCIDIVRNGGKE